MDVKVFGQNGGVGVK